jgi:hypothetical protein
MAIFIERGQKAGLSHRSFDIYRSKPVPSDKLAIVFLADGWPETHAGTEVSLEQVRASSAKTAQPAYGY